jgi:DNA-directed RNA polymerase specialized sigma24 family protein
MESKVTAKCLFEECDYAEIRELMAFLPEPEFRIVYLRYWATYSITQISQELRMSWDAVDRRLNHALSTLRSLYPLNRDLPQRSQASAA